MGKGRKHSEIWLGCVGLLLVSAIALGTAIRPPILSAQAGATGVAPTPSPSGIMPSAVDIFARPTLPPQPAQADQGSQVYWLRCMVCHGDHGQGLTDAYRAAWPKVDQNCWQAKCHGDVRNPESFTFPKYVPPIIGPGTLSRFRTAADLHDFIQGKMPYQAPGSLEDQDYWELTAFLARAGGAHLTGRALDAGSAASVDLRPQASASMPWPIVTAGLASMALLIGLALWWRARCRPA